MDETQRRAMHDQHSQDEARARLAQQQAAGGGAPVQRYPSHGAESPLPQGDASADAVVTLYDEACARERDAWSRVHGLPGQPAFEQARWDEWRAAVEVRDRATRFLVNHSLGVA